MHVNIFPESMRILCFMSSDATNRLPDMWFKRVVFTQASCDVFPFLNDLNDIGFRHEPQAEFRLLRLQFDTRCQ